ncbi:cwf18 pre-mRNA splicing factor-domain-containing protein [Phycomyces blakesleeanus]|uniref:Cwf18 pre-mRNA splicing factor-domain-containing protein n=1 Tax=Phycomyces blakesleeanus TaxID=4837 RepID=A0ABR3AQW6_PHYBL
MEEEAIKRKERLEALRKRKLGSSVNNRTTEDSEKKLSFRSYTPADEKLKQHVKIATPDDIGETVETETKEITKEVLAKAAVKEKEEVDLFNLAPKKANWDLKRDVEKKLEKLDRRTQRAVLEILRQRLTEEDAAAGGNQSNLAEVVANAEAQQKLEAQDE